MSHDIKYNIFSVVWTRDVLPSAQVHMNVCHASSPGHPSQHVAHRFWNIKMMAPPPPQPQPCCPLYIRWLIHVECVTLTQNNWTIKQSNYTKSESAVMKIMCLKSNGGLLDPTRRPHGTTVYSYICYMLSIHRPYGWVE